MSINERFKIIINDLYSGNKRAFANAVGVNPTVIENVVGVRNGNPSFEVLQKVLYAIANISPDWLILGNGSMIRTENKLKYEEKEPEILVLNQSIEKKYDRQLIPVYDMNAAAGLNSLFNDSSNYHPVDYISLPKMGKVDGALFAFGDSMYPLIKSGDIIVYRQLHDLLNSIITGEMYLLSFDLEGEEYIVVKYIQESELPGCIKLVSQNQHHQPKDIPLSSVRALAQIKASVRFNIMRSGI